MIPIQSQAVTDTAVWTSGCVCRADAEQLHNLCKYSPIPKKTTQISQVVYLINCLNPMT